MWRIAVAVKAVSILPASHCFKGSAGSVAEKRLMAAEAVFLNHPLPRFPDVDGLRFIAKGKYCRVSQSVACLEIVFPYEAVMRNMAGIAVSDAAVGAVRPCGELRGHYVAVDTDPGIIREIGGGIRYLQNIECQACERTEKDNDRYTPQWRRRKETDQSV